MNRQIRDLIRLVRRRYPDWEDCAHPDFMADEIDYKQTTVEKAAAWLNQDELDRLIADSDFVTCLDRLVKLSQDNNLLWRRVPSQGDTAVLHHPHLDKPAFCTQVRNLLASHRLTPLQKKFVREELERRSG